MLRVNGREVSRQEWLDNLLDVDGHLTGRGKLGYLARKRETDMNSVRKQIEQENRRTRRKAQWELAKLALDVMLKFALLVGGVAAGIYFASLGFLP